MFPGQGARVRVLIEVPRGGFVKREVGAGVDYVSPVPSPFNYGCIPELPGADGDPLDVVVLGPALRAGERVEVVVRGVVRFVDAGAVDDKLVASALPPSPGDWRAVTAFFRVYARARRALNLAGGRRGRTAFLGVEREVACG